MAYNLSRKNESDASLCAISIVVLEWNSEVQSEYVKDPETRKLIEEVENNKATNSKYSWEKDILWYKQRIYLASLSKFKTQVLKENHDSPIVGHVGFFKTYHNIHQFFFWKGMKNDIQKYLAECDTCQGQKYKMVDPLNLLHPLHILSKKWYEVSMDFITNLPTSKGKDSIFVVLDKLTKYDNFISISSK